jgi:hypothetical protein
MNVADNTNKENIMTTFNVNQTYSVKSICDSECVFSYTVIKRTAKRITIKDKFNRIEKRGISIINGQEICYPEGKYSMCPVIRA